MIPSLIVFHEEIEMPSAHNRRYFGKASLHHILATGISSSALLANMNSHAMERSAYRVAVMGHTGRGDFGHGLDKMWQKIGNTETVAISDSAGIEYAKRRMPGVEAFGDYRVMLRAVKPEIVSIAPRHVDQHHAMCMEAIQNQVKGIYIEKPFCQTPRQADEILTACNQTGVRLAVAHRNRYHPVLDVVKDSLEAGEIGKPLEIRARGKEDQRGGALDLWVLGSHLLNVACFLAGDPISCQGQLLQDKRLCEQRDVREGDEGVGLIAGDELHARYEMSSGIPLFFDSMKNHGVRSSGFGLQVVGQEGVIDLRMDREPVAHIRRGNPFHPTTKPSSWQPISTAGIGQPETIQGLGSYISSHHAAGDNLVQAIQRGRQPMCDASQGRQTVEMICGVFASHRQGGATVQFPLENRENPLS